MSMKPRQLGALAVMVLVTIVSAAGAFSNGKYLSPQAVIASRDGKTLYIAETTAARVAVVDLASGRVARQIELPAAPGGLALAPDGSRLYVTGAVPAGNVFVVDPAAGKIDATIAVGHTPMAPVVSPDGKLLYVCNRFNNNVDVIDLAAGKVTAEVAVTREPVAAGLTPDGAFLFVANHLPTGPANADTVAATVSVIDTRSRKVCKTIDLLNGSTGVRGLCLSPDGKFVYVTHTLGRYQLPTTQLERGWMNTNALTIIDAAKQEIVNTVLLDDIDLGAANPWAVACTADGSTLCITHAGTQELSVIDRRKLHEALDQVARGIKFNEVTSSASEVPNDLSFLVGMRTRVKLAGLGPRGLAIAGNKAYATGYFSDGVDEVNLDSSSSAVARTIALGPKVEMDAVRRGEMFFADASLCFQQWQSCTSCHPDTRADALNWDLLNDGIGNPKNAKSLLFAHKTPPAMSLGVRPNAEYAVRSGIKYIQFAVRPEADACAIDEYLMSVRPVPSPHLTRDGKLTPAAIRGKGVFVKAGCIECHSGPYHTSLQKYDVGTGNDREKEFDTPTLVEVWRTAPYLHDGRAKTIRDVVTTDNIDDQHGSTKELTKEELNDLIEYVLSL